MTVKSSGALRLPPSFPVTSRLFTHSALPPPSTSTSTFTPPQPKVENIFLLPIHISLLKTGKAIVRFLLLKLEKISLPPPTPTSTFNPPPQPPPTTNMNIWILWRYITNSPNNPPPQRVHLPKKEVHLSQSFSTLNLPSPLLQWTNQQQILSVGLHPISSCLCRKHYLPETYIVTFLTLSQWLTETSCL